ncbi:MAG: hypothetical protein GY765_38535 [bacterium]|nr:hypothetical protein [bacterium]
MIVVEEKEINRKFFFLNSLRISVLSILLFAAVFVFLLTKGPFPFFPIVLSLVIAIGFSVLNFQLFKHLKFRFAQYLQSLVDVSLISILVYYTGGITSPFYFLYTFPIIVASTFLTRKDTIAVATFSYIVFCAVSNLIFLEVIPYYPLFPGITITSNVFVYNLVMSFIAFSGVAVLSSHYFERMRKTGEELRNTRETLKDLMLLNNTVLERMGNGFIVCNSKGTVISYNEKARFLLDLKTGSNIFSLFALHLDEPADLSDSTPGTLRNRRYYFEEEVKDLVLGVSYSIIDQIYSFDKVFVFIITDLTEKRAIEKKLKRKEHFALIGEMSAGIAHEIRNPLASISGSVQFLHKELELDEQPEFQHLMEIIVKESTRLSNSIEVFLDYAKTTPLKKKEQDVSVVVDEVVELIALNHPEIKMIRKYGKGNIIKADIRKMNQVVWNLLNNAVKALGDNGCIEIAIYSKQEVVFLSIKDNGIGIDAENLQRIFTPFYSRFTSGIGLGMAIVKRIIDEHNFTIEIKSEKNIGTEVIICFQNK